MTDTKVRVNIFERDRFRCRGCAKPAADIHHIIFRSQGGTDDLSNLVALCRSCHEQAHGRVGTKLAAWVLQAMVAYDKFRVCCGVWKFFAAKRNCLTCELRTVDYQCLILNVPVTQMDGCDSWALRSLSIQC
jgi:hypothetical protein